MASSDTLTAEQGKRWKFLNGEFKGIVFRVDMYDDTSRNWTLHFGAYGKAQTIGQDKVVEWGVRAL